MKKIVLLLTGVICLLHLSSCSDFLNQTPSHQAEASTSIQSVSDAKVMIDGLMRKMGSTSYYGRNKMLYGDAKGGDYVVPALGRSGGMDQLYTFGHTASSNSFSGYWVQIYNCLLQVNNLLSNIESLEASGAVMPGMDSYKGQALTLRALMYFDLVRLYGYPYTKDNGASLGVPLVINVLDVFETPKRATVAEVYTQILKDLGEGGPLLNKTRANGYVNYFANRAILAKVNLYMGKYAESLAAAEEVLSSSLYTLYSNTSWLTSWASEFGSESIFEIGIYLNESDGGSSSLGRTITRNQKLGAMGQFVASDYFLESLGEDATDIRWGIMDYDEFSQEYSSSFTVTRLGCCNKYIGNVNGAGDKGGSSATAVNIKVIRLSEVYLIAAEAALPSNKSKAANYLQEIRKRSPNLAPATETTVSIDMILTERQKELFGEGQRFFDMMRLNRPITYNDEILMGGVGGNRAKTIDNWNFNRIVLPISQAELDANQSIKDQQNPGY